MNLGTPSLKSLFGCLHRTRDISLLRTFFNHFISCRSNGTSDTLSLYKYLYLLSLLYLPELSLFLFFIV